MKLTREQAWDQALADALQHFQKCSRVKDGKPDDMYTALYHGCADVRRRLEAGTLRTNHMSQLIACALDCLGAGYFEASERGEVPRKPTPEELS